MTYLSISIGDRAPVTVDSFDRRQELSRADGYVDVPDEGWEFTDAFGHVHRWVHRDGWVLPSLVKTMVPCDGMCGDPEHEVPEWHCAYCDIVVEPKSNSVYQVENIPGLIEITATFRVPGRWPHPDRVDGVVVYEDGQPHLAGRGDVVNLQARENSRGWTSTVTMRITPSRSSALVDAAIAETEGR